MDDQKRTGRRYVVFFALVSALFIGLLGFVYNRVSHTKILMLDEHGKTVVAR